MQDKQQDESLYFEKGLYQKIVALVIACYVIFLILLSFPEYSESDEKKFILAAFGIIFILEYLSKVAVTLYCGKSLKWTLGFYSVVDLIAILSFSFSYFFHYNFLFLRILRVIRILTVFKNNPVSRALKTLTVVINRKKYDLMASFTILLILLLVASCAIFCFENDAQPQKFSSIIHSFWWAVITMTTVGYGDIYPITAAGKITAAVFALIGFGFITLPAAIISTGYLNMRNEDSFKSSDSGKDKSECSN
ncbi:MAG: ion transporter [Lentisphaeraceae bacterium]|nr:ion transporter [Lentisphaeraceae bacterium]